MRDYLFLLLLFLSLFALAFSGFIPLTDAAGQPPIVTNTLWVGEDSYSFIGIHGYGWGPVDADPAVAHDCQSKELIINCYQGLLAWNQEQYYDFIPLLATNVPTLQSVTLTVTNTSAVAVGTDPTGSTWTDGSTSYTLVHWTDELGDGFGRSDVFTLSPGYFTWTIDVMTGTSTITLQLWRGYYVFNIRTSPTIYFYDDNGNHVGAYATSDAAYSFQRDLVIHEAGNPTMKLTVPLFDLTDYSGFNNDTAMTLANMINSAIVPDTVANTLTINIGTHYPDNAFKQVLSDTVCDILSKNNTVALGGWDGNLFITTKYGGPEPDWWIDWSNQGSGIHYATRDPSDLCNPSVYIGTGPYDITTIDHAGEKVVLQRNPDFWMGWPCPGSSGFVDTVEIDYIEDWATRKADFLSGSIDLCAIPRANMFELLNNITGQPVTPAIKTIRNVIPVFDVDTVQFTFNINNASTYIGTGSMPGGIPLDFFNNTHCRKAFAYSFNWSTYGSQVCFGEADYRQNWCVQGLYPDYYNVTGIPGYYESLSSAEAELKAAMFGGQSVWNTGFTVTLAFKDGIDMAKIACEMISSFFTTLSTFDGRSGSPFVVNVQAIDSPTLFGSIVQKTLPIYVIGWPANYADTDDFVRTYMHSEGELAFFEGYTADNGWGSVKDILIDKAALTPDGSARAAMYTQLQQIYFDDCPSIPIPVVRGRMWMWYWVKGWYYNALCPGLYFYPLWKQDNPWYDISGSPPTGAVGISDGIVNMKDIAYLIAHFNAKAPVPGQPIDPKWVGVYGANGCVDPYGDRSSNMKDIAGAILSFNAHGGTGHP
jgi:peptide/nickel transport system substrate-binding protein